MKTLTIRRWLLLAWLGIIVLGNLAFQVAIYIQRWHEPGQWQPPALAALQTEVAANVARWPDPAWQSTLVSKVATWGGAITLRDERGRVQFQHGSIASPVSPTAIMLLLANGHQVGRAEWFAPDQEDPRWTFTKFSLVLFLFLLFSGVASWFLGRMVLKPLAAMSLAARQIAAGDLNFNLPPSRVREVVEVSAAFHAMGDALQTALERQAELEQERRLFISAVAHDLRTPLFSLRGYLEGLTTNIAATPAKRAHYLAVCQEQAAVLDQRIAALFAYARLEYLEQTPRCAALDLGALLQQLVARFRPLLEEKRVRLQVSGPTALAILGDGPLLTRALENLLDNALRYTPSGGTIEVTWHPEPGRIDFAVADTGPGVAPEDMPHLFKPLYRSEPSRNRRTDGAGLGLTIAQRILQAHGGGLTVKNRATGGAEFAGWLPHPSHGKIA